jgi:ribose-phosphate pyrophosphokinase
MFKEVPEQQNWFKSWQYPGGEIGVRLIEPKKNFIFRIQDTRHHVELMMLLDCFVAEGIHDIHLTIPYLAYARQDRVATKGDPLAIQVLARNIAASRVVSEVRSLDVHSPASFDAFDNAGIRLVNIHPAEYIIKYLIRVGYTSNDKICVVIPDKGASLKAADTINRLNLDPRCPNISYIQFEKERNPHDGTLKGFKIADAHTGIKYDGYDFVIIDDICDGGGTFVGIANIIKEKFGSPKIHLFTSHGIYSKGILPLVDIFNTVGCTDSFFNSLGHERLFIEKLNA